MEINTERLLLRKYQKDELEFFLKIFNNPDITKFSSGFPGNSSNTELFYKIFDIYAKKKSDFYIWSVCLKSNKIIGHCELKKTEFTKENELEIVYFLLPEYWNKGYATEISKEVIKLGLEKLPVKSIIATIDPDNINSIKVVEKIRNEIKRNLKR